MVTIRHLVSTAVQNLVQQWPDLLTRYTPRQFVPDLIVLSLPLGLRATPTNMRLRLHHCPLCSKMAASACDTKQGTIQNF